MPGRLLHPLETGPLFTAPIRLGKILKWLPIYFSLDNPVLRDRTWRMVADGSGAELMKPLSFGWIAVIWVRSMNLIVVTYGRLEARLYLRRHQGARFNYNAKFPSDQRSHVFMFRSLNIDSIIRGFGTGIPLDRWFGTWQVAPSKATR